MSKYEWLLFLHVTGAFLFLGGVVMAWVLGIAAARRERPSEIALLMGLAQRFGAAFGGGLLLLLVFGIWLVHAAGQGYSFKDGWIVAALVLVVLLVIFGGIAGRRDAGAHRLARRLAAEGDLPSAELVARVRDPVALAFNLASSLLGFVILALMIWKPGAP